jgi:hypothetical protein
MPKKILTIDGGGLRGVFSSAIIEQIEKVVVKKAGEYFDCFLWTSTRAILAALANSISASEPKQFYSDKRRNGFYESAVLADNPAVPLLDYSKEPLEDELKIVFKQEKSLTSKSSSVSRSKTSDEETSSFCFFAAASLVASLEEVPA